MAVHLPARGKRVLAVVVVASLAIAAALDWCLCNTAWGTALYADLQAAELFIACLAVAIVVVIVLTAATIAVFFTPRAPT